MLLLMVFAYKRCATLVLPGIMYVWYDGMLVHAYVHACPLVLPVPRGGRRWLGNAAPDGRGPDR